jgi:quinohemoprotein ethanol dehydrogenase
VSLLCGIFVLSRVAQADNARAAGGSSQMIQRGEQLYRANCASCHGSSAINAGPVPDLRRSDPAIIAALDQYVLDGIDVARGMPSFARTLQRQDVAPLQAYLNYRARLLHQ